MFTNIFLRNTAVLKSIELAIQFYSDETFYKDKIRIF